MGCDIRVLQMEGAKDPDEYIIKYGNARFQTLIDKALSVIEFKSVDVPPAGSFVAEDTPVTAK